MSWKQWEKPVLIALLLASLLAAWQFGNMKVRINKLEQRVAALEK